MKKYRLIALALIAAQLSFAKDVTPPAEIPDYYASVDGLGGASLFNAVASVTLKGKTELGYGGLYTAYETTDVYPADSTDKKGLVWDMYSDCGFSFDNTCGSYKVECDCYNREHSIPQSWWGGGTGGIGNDIFHVLPTDGKVNGIRNNYCYGEVEGSPNYVSKMGHKRGSGAAIIVDRATICSQAGDAVPWGGDAKNYVFEPIDRYKGDLARGIMGTLIAWREDLTDENGKYFFQSDFDKSSNFGLTKYGVALLMKWHRLDPVSQKEIDRNNGIQATQGNRNPFIDYPYLAEYIWGEHAGEDVNMNELLASCEEGFIPGVSNGWKEDIEPIDPAQPVVKYGVNWSVNGSIIQTDSIAEDHKIKELPAEPKSFSSESEAFVGWTDAPITGISDEAPEHLYIDAKEMPAVTADVTYYAVFAHVEIEGASTPATYTYDESHQDGWQCSAQWNKTYCLLKKGTEIISPEVELVGLKSIDMTLRTYGGSDNATVTVKADGKQIATLTANNNKLNPYSWTNSSTLSGKAALHFTAYKSDKQGVGISQIVINATGSTAVQSRFVTSDGTTALDHAEHAVKARKIMVNGQLYILVGENRYTVTGQRIE